MSWMEISFRHVKDGQQHYNLPTYNLPTSLPFCSAMTQNGKRIWEAHLSYYVSAYNRVET